MSGEEVTAFGNDLREVEKEGWERINQYLVLGKEWLTQKKTSILAKESIVRIQ